MQSFLFEVIIQLFSNAVTSIIINALTLHYFELTAHEHNQQCQWNVDQHHLRLISS